jgi:putative membrane protein
MTPTVETKGPQTNLSNELAKERSRDAAERTLLAWIRTGFSMTSFGFGIPALVGVLSKTELYAEADYLVTIAYIFGIIYICLGVFAIIVAMFQYRNDLLQLEQEEYHYQRGFPLGFVVAGVIGLIGVASLLGLALKLIAR